MKREEEQQPRERRREARRDFVGRTRELRDLLRALDEAAAGSPRVRLLLGEAGIGKTRLATELAGTAREGGWRVLWASCEQGAHVPAYWPWTQLLRGALEPLPQAERDALLGAAAGELAAIAPGLGSAGLPNAGDLVEPSEARFRLFDAMATCWRRLARDQGVVLVIDDLHQADPVSLEVLHFVARHVEKARLLVVSTCREEDARRDPRRAALMADLSRVSRRVRLTGLDPDHVADLVEWIAGEPAPEGLAEAIHSRTGGNPFFIDEIVRLLIAEGSLEGADLELLRVPDEVGAAIRRRLSHVDPETRRILGLAAVLGSEFELDLLARVAEASRSALAALLGSPGSSPAIRPERGGRYAFLHGLVHETVYEDLLPDERVRLHARVGEALEARPARVGHESDRGRALAHHFLRAAAEGEHARKAIDYACAAGRIAREEFAYSEADDWLEGALRVLALAPDPARQLACELDLAEVRVLAGRLDDARATAKRALHLAREFGDGESVARAAVCFAGGGESGFAPEPGRAEILEEGLRALGEGPSARRARVMSQLAEAIHFSERHAESVAMAQEALAIARGLGDQRAVAYALNTLRWVGWKPANAPERVAMCEEMVKLGEALDSRSLTFEGHSGRLHCLLELGDTHGADAARARIDQISREVRRQDIDWGTEQYLSCRAAMEGRLDDAEGHARAALALGEQFSARIANEWFAIQLITIREAQGRYEEILPALRRLAADQPRAVVRAGLTRILCRAGHLDEARELFLGLMKDLDAVHVDVNWPYTLACLAEACDTLNDHRHARRLYDVLAPYDGRQVVLGLKLAWGGPVSRVLGLLARLDDRRRDAIRHFEDALAQCRGMGARAGEVEVLANLARARAELGDLALARELQEQARSLAAELGMAHRAPGPTHALYEPDVDAAPEPAAPASPAAHGQRAVLRRSGDTWQIGFEDRVEHFREVRGFQYLSRLLADPGREWHAVDLVTADADHDAARPSGDAGEALDRRARRQYGARLEDLQAELAEAERFDDAVRACAIREEIDAIAGELARGFGLGGRERRDGSAAERARVNATRAIRLAIRRIDESDPSLGRHLRDCVRTGAFCRYEPNPDQPVVWSL